ncbi:hypothetical protein GQX73_g9595 [Xylaria multiplex]|uniref:RRM domain-containing protein n=1 Tax=Xylaria multiplex TaxID=323545 RepID=A0A7C8IHS8_9PEZI|nr:hypothetical protein GQX73_g9595 [Xylaria multiplex]
MSNMVPEEGSPATVTVRPGSKTKFYFVPITGLQKGTHFRDVWLHLKKVVKRLEHIEVYPDSTEGWICVHRQSNFLKVLSTLRDPIHVQATDVSTVVTSSEKNQDEQVTIRLPVSCSEHVSTMIKHSSCPTALPASGKPVTTDSTTQASDDKPRYEVVIAHGTYHPPEEHGNCNLIGSDAGYNTPRYENQSPARLPSTYGGSSQATPSESSPGSYFEYSPYHSNDYAPSWQTGTDYSNSPTLGPAFAYSAYEPVSAISPGYWFGGHQFFDESAYMNPGCYYWDPSINYAQPTGYSAPFVPTKPATERCHTVLLSNFQRTTTTYQVEELVKCIARRCRLRDRRIRVVDGVMIVTKTKGDARKLRDGLNGQILNGEPIRARRGWRAPPGVFTNFSTPIWG